MNQLKEVSFINSATLPFATIDVGANTLFSGGNGAGKTTILRSILYFYGAGRSEHLGISRKKKRFEEYYFASINSYLVYRFENENSTVLAIVYKAGGLRVKYRFAIERNKEEIKELFFESNLALEPKELWARLHEKEYELSPVLNSPKEYKSVLYGQDKKLSQFAFFRANTEYEQISKTLSNVFINSKLDSGSIKKSLVSSISGFEAIDLNQMRRNISDFRVQYDDISSFEKNASVINEAVVSLGVYEEQTRELHHIASSLGANTKDADSELSFLKDKTMSFKQELLILEENYEKRKKAEALQHDADLKEQGALERDIKEAESKQKEYEKLNIKHKLELYEKKPLLEDELLALQSQLSKLLDSQGSLSERFEKMREDELKSFHDKEQKLRSDMTTIEQKFNHANAEFLQEQELQVSAYRQEADLKIEALSTAVFKAKEEHLSASSHEKIIHNRSFDKEKIEQAKNEHFKAVRSFESEQAKLQLLQSEGQKVAEQIFSAEQSKSYALQNLSTKHEQDSQALKLQIQDLIKRKNLNSSSLLAYMKEKDFENSVLLSALLKDEILYAENLNPFLSQGDGTLLGLELDTSVLDLDAYEESALMLSLSASQERLKRMDENALVEKEELENETKNSINALRREQGRINTLIDESLRKLPKLEKESLFLAEKLQSFQNLAAKKKDEELSLARITKDEKEKVYKELLAQEQILKMNLSQELQNLQNELKSKQDALIEEKTALVNAKKDELVNIKTLCDKSFKKIKEEEDETLVKGGVDPALLKKYQDNIKDKENELKNIDSFSELISEYKIDQKRIFSSIELKVKALLDLSKKIQTEEKVFQEYVEKYELDKEELSKNRDLFVNKLNKLQKDLKEYLNFKETTLYLELIEYIENTQLESTQESLSEMINRLRDLGFEHASSKDRLRKKLNRAFSSLSLHNIFNLYAPASDSDKAILASAHGLKTFVLENKIQTYKEQVAKEFTMTLRHLSSEVSELLKAEGDISKTVSRINKTLQDLQGIKVIRGIELRYKESDNLLLNVLKAIGVLVEENPYGNEINLFSAETNEHFNKKALKHLEELSLHLNEEKSDSLSLDESFVLEFRAIENGNDTGFVASLDGIGSNGTDVMVKAMVNIAMLSLARKQSSKQDASVYFHCILDEVGILSPAYLKELIAYANNKKIRFVNGAPDEKLVSTYKRLYMLSTNAKHQTIVRKLVSQS